MTIKELQTGLWYIGVQEENLRRFHSVAFSDAGMMYGAYLMDAGDCCVLLGALPARYASALADEAAVLAGDKPVHYGVLFGTADDIACAGVVSRCFPGIRLIAGKASLFSLDLLGALPENAIEIRAKRTLTLGNKTLEFHILSDRFETPCLYVLDRAGGTLFTADAFGSFGAFEAVRVSDLDDTASWLRGARQYFADIRGQGRKAVMEKAIALVRDSGVQTICPALGAVIDTKLDDLLSVYQEKDASGSACPTVAVIHTGSASVALMAQRIAKGIAEHPVAVLDLDLSAMSRDDVLAALPHADAYLFGTDDCDGNAAKSVWDIATSLQRCDATGKPAAVFYTQNAGNHVPDALRAYLTSLGMRLDMPDWFVSGKVSSSDLKNAVDYGFGIGCSVLGIPNPRQPKLVKCLVCGEIFDATLGACPVCGVGLEQCQPVDKEEITYRRDTNRRYLIIGGCSAGVAAAEAIRQRDATGQIDILSAENHLPINRPMITKGIIDEVVSAPENIHIHPAQWYDERNIILHLGCTASKIDPKVKAVMTSDGAVWGYDRLILATGAECFMPPFKGRDLEGVITVRHLADAENMVRCMRTCKSAVVIGGGVLGLEAAGELMKSAIPVTVLEATPQIMWKQVDAASSAYLRQRMKAAHTDCHEGVSVEAIEGNESGHVTGVRLEDGRFFPADMVIVSCGMKASTALAAEAGIKADRAIEVDMFMRTNLPDIYACGDCCSFDGVNYQLVQEASAQGRVAGAHAAGDGSVYYANRILGMHVEGVGASMYAIGDAGKNEKLRYKTVKTQDEVANRKETYWFAKGVLQGAVVINADEKIHLLTQSLEQRARHADMF